MEEYEIDLIDYIRTVWKRKMLIIVGTLVCIAAAVVVSLMLPVTYRADAVMKVGKRLELAGTSPAISNYFESPRDLAEIIPIKYYKQNSKEASGYHLDVNVIVGTSMINIIMSGPNRGIEKSLKDIIDRIIDAHYNKVNNSVIPYKQLIEKLEADAKVILGSITLIERRIKEMNSKGNAFLGDTTVSEAKIEEGLFLDDRSAFLNTWYLKTLNKEEELNQSRRNLREVQGQLIMYRRFVDHIDENNTELIGKVNINTIKLRMIRYIILAGVGGLIMSLVLVFLTDYIYKAVKVKGDSV